MDNPRLQFLLNTIQLNMKWSDKEKDDFFDRVKDFYRLHFKGYKKRRIYSSNEYDEIDIYTLLDLIIHTTDMRMMFPKKNGLTKLKDNTPITTIQNNMGKMSDIAAFIEQHDLVDKFIQDVMCEGYYGYDFMSDKNPMKNVFMRYVLEKYEEYHFEKEEEKEDI